MKNVTVAEGGTAEFVCRITSSLHPHVVWVKHYQVNGSYQSEDGKSYYRKISPHQVHYPKKIRPIAFGMPSSLFSLSLSFDSF